MAPFLDNESVVLSQSAPSDEHSDFSMFKWNENDESSFTDMTTDDDAMSVDTTSDYIDQYLDDLELDLDISYAPVGDATATCVAIHSPGKPKLVDIPPSPSVTSPDSERGLLFKSQPADEQDPSTHSHSTSSSYSSPSSAATTPHRRTSDTDRESDSCYSPVTPRSSVWSLPQPEVADETALPDTHVLHEQESMQTPSSTNEPLKSPFTPYGAVFAAPGETFDDAKMVVKDHRKSLLPIQIPTTPRESSLWKQAKAHAKTRKKSMGTSWFR
ncbi:MAG: hypothetical protein M1828_005717 [Chrysothrix sp. TS-e1954]|nr:MAG: hypothetical protein M1828_005717 [Chrysothrix sp. TS-e1954]